jgi:hypothetical protein
MLAIMGRMSRAMLERYSHIRMAAKSAAVEALTTMKEQPVSSEVHKSPHNDQSDWSSVNCMLLI